MKSDSHSELESVLTPIEALAEEHEFARIRNCSVATVRRDRLLRRGCPYVKLGATVRYRLDDIRDFIRRNVQQREAR